jgi:hypothetical protein
MQERAFPGSGRSDDRDHLAAVNRKINSVERRDFLGARVEDFAKVFRAQDLPRVCDGPIGGVV